MWGVSVLLLSSDLVHHSHVSHPWAWTRCPRAGARVVSQPTSSTVTLCRRDSPSNSDYPTGGRLCQSWLTSFSHLVRDVGPKFLGPRSRRKLEPEAVGVRREPTFHPRKGGRNPSHSLCHLGTGRVFVTYRVDKREDRKEGRRE